MALNPMLLANDMKGVMGFEGPVSVELIGIAIGIIQNLQQDASASFGGFPGPHPISGVTGALIAAKIAPAAGFPEVTPELLAYGNGIAKHFSEEGFVVYPGPPIPPPPGFNVGGKVFGITGAGLADSIKEAMGFDSVTDKLLNQCTAIVDHILQFGEVNSGVIT